MESSGFDQLFRRADESAPGGTGERAADADAPHAEFSGVVHGKTDRATDEKVDRFRCHRFDNHLDVVAFFDAGRIEAIGARLRVSDEPLNYLVDVFAAEAKPFGRSEEHTSELQSRFGISY